MAVRNAQIPVIQLLTILSVLLLMSGRIMAGSQAVVAHIEDGRAIFFDYLPPDTRLPRIIIDFCAEIADLTGIRTYHSLNKIQVILISGSG